MSLLNSMELIANGSFEEGRDSWPTIYTSISNNEIDGMWSVNGIAWVNFYEYEPLSWDNVPNWDTSADQNGDIGNVDIVFKPEYGMTTIDGTAYLELDGSLPLPTTEEFSSQNFEGGSHGYFTQTLLEPLTNEGQLSYYLHEHPFALDSSDYGLFIDDQLAIAFTFDSTNNTWSGDIQSSLVSDFAIEYTGTGSWDKVTINLNPSNNSADSQINTIGFQGGSWDGSSFNPKEQQDNAGAFIDGVSLQTTEAEVDPITGTLGLPGKVNLKNQGKTPFVLYGNKDLFFDTSDQDTLINPDTLGFGSNSGQTLFTPATKKNGATFDSYEDVNSDGFLDYVVKVETPMIASNVQSGEQELVASATTNGGEDLLFSTPNEVLV